MAEVLDNPDVTSEPHESNESFNRELQDMLIIGRHERAEQRAHELQQPQPDDVEGFSHHWRVEPQLAQTIIEQAQERQPFIRAAHRISRDNLKTLIDSGGQLKSFFDTGTTHGGKHANAESYAEVRRAYEEKYSLRASDDPEIVHGFLEDIDQLGEQDVAEGYGGVEIVFKADVLDRSVYTTGDSLQNGEPPTDMMSALRSRELQSRLKQTGEHNIFRNYAEVLVLDEASLQDAESLVFNDVNNLNYDATIQTVDELHQQYPDISFTLRIDATDTVYLKKLLQLVSEKSYINVVLAVQTQSPFLRTKMGDTSEGTRNNFADKTARLRELEQKMIVRWEELGHAGEPLPEGIKTAVVLPGPSKNIS